VTIAVHDVAELLLAIMGMQVAYLLGRSRMAAERPMGGARRTWIVTKDNRMGVLLIADDESAVSVMLDQSETRKMAMSALEDEDTLLPPASPGG